MAADPMAADPGTATKPADDAEQMRTARTGGVVRAGAMMAVATLASRLTGFVAKAMLLAVLGVSIVSDSYNVANTLPNIVFELVIGGVLTSVAIPLLSRARSDPDGGELYTQRLVTTAFVGLLGVTVLAVIAAPVFTAIYVSGGDQADPQLTTQLGRLLLPQIFFYGMAALFGAILNTKERFAAPAWAPLVNNLVVIVVAVAIGFAPGGVFGADGGMVGLSAGQLWLLGLGTTAGIVAQAAVMLPSLLRSGFRFRWRWGNDPRLAEAGRLMLWSIAYALISAVSFIVTTRVFTGNLAGSLTAFTFASMLFQLPYGILGVSVLTAIMPRMSRHAAAGRIEDVKNDASLANRLSTIALMPVAVAMLVLSTPLAVVTAGYGNASTDGVAMIGGTLAGMALGLVPLAVTLVQMRVFYAMKDARTPTLINAVMVAVRIPLVLFCGTLRPDLVAPGIALATTVSYLVGAIVGEIWLRVRFGPMGTMRLLVTVAKMIIAGGLAGGAAWLFGDLTTDDAVPGVSGALAQLAIGGVIGLIVLVPAMLLLRVREVDPVRRRIARILGFGGGSAAPDAGATGGADAAGGDRRGTASDGSRSAVGAATARGMAPSSGQPVPPSTVRQPPTASPSVRPAVPPSLPPAASPAVPPAASIPVSAPVPDRSRQEFPPLADTPDRPAAGHDPAGSRPGQPARPVEDDTELDLFDEVPAAPRDPVPPPGQQPGTPQSGNPQPGTPQPGAPQPGTQQPDTQQPHTRQPGRPGDSGVSPAVVAASERVAAAAAADAEDAARATAAADRAAAEQTVGIPGGEPADGESRAGRHDPERTVTMSEAEQPTRGAGPGPDRAGPPVALAPGMNIGGRYRLVTEVATDTAGDRFWRAKDTVLPRDMAVTLLPDSSGTSATVARTLRAGRLHHIGLPQTLDLGTEHGQTFVVGQWVDGATLTDLLARGPLEPAVATSITSKISEAVAEAHRNGLALGSISPSLVRVNVDGQVRFSHVIAHAAATPEDDIRAVGGLMYLMLTGTWPDSEHLPKVPGANFPAPPRAGNREVPANEVNPEVPAPLAAVAERALHPEDPDGINAIGAIASLLRAPEASADIAGALTSPAAGHEPAPEPPPPTMSPADRRLRKERRFKLGLATVLMAAFVAMILIVVATMAKNVLADIDDANQSSLDDLGAAATSSVAATTVKPTAESGPATSSAASSAASSSAPTTSSSTAPPPAAPVQVVAGSVYDPEGSGTKDYVEKVDLTFDGNPSTSWLTWQYFQQFAPKADGGYKVGVGLVLELEKEVTVRSVEVTTERPSMTVQIRGVSGMEPGAFDSTKLLGSGEVGEGPAVIPVTGAEKSKFICVFLTQIPPNQGGFQGVVNEIVVKGN